MRSREGLGPRAVRRQVGVRPAPADVHDQDVDAVEVTQGVRRDIGGLVVEIELRGDRGDPGRGDQERVPRVGVAAGATEDANHGTSLEVAGRLGPWLR